MMSEFTGFITYKDIPFKSIARVELTSTAMERLEDEQTAETLFTQLKEQGLLPKGVSFNSQIKNQSADTSLTYKNVLMAVLQGLGDADRDNLFDVSIIELRTTLISQGIIKKETSSEQLVQAIITRTSSRKLQYYPPVFTPYDQNQGAAYTESSLYYMSKLTDQLPQNVSAKEFFDALSNYFEKGYIHVDETTSLKGSDVPGESIEITSSTILNPFFTFHNNKLVVDCQIYSKVARLAIVGSKISGVKDLSVRFISMEYFGEKNGHVALEVTYTEKTSGNRITAIINNGQVVMRNGVLTIDQLVKMFSADGKLVSSFTQGNKATQGTNTPEAYHGLNSQNPLSIRMNSLKYLGKQSIYLTSKNTDPAKIVIALASAVLNDTSEVVRHRASMVLQDVRFIKGADGQADISPEVGAAIDTLRTSLGTEKNHQVRLNILKILHNLGRINQKEFVEGLKEELGRLVVEGKENAYSTVLTTIAKEGEIGFAVLKQIIKETEQAYPTKAKEGAVLALGELINVKREKVMILIKEIFAAPNFHKQAVAVLDRVIHCHPYIHAHESSHDYAKQAVETLGKELKSKNNTAHKEILWTLANTYRSNNGVWKQAREILIWAESLAPDQKDRIEAEKALKSLVRYGAK